MELIWILSYLGACAKALEWSRGREVSRATLEAAPADWRKWLKKQVSAGDGSSHDSGFDTGTGSSDGSGFGDGSGSGDGDGAGYGYSYDDGSATGYGGYGVCSGNGSGTGSDDGYNDGCGYGSGTGYGDGHGYSDGSGYGTGCSTEHLVEIQFVSGKKLQNRDQVSEIYASIAKSAKVASCEIT